MTPSGTGTPVDETGPAVAVVVARDGRLPVGAADATAAAGGRVVVVGSGTEAGARALLGARLVRWGETGPRFQPARLAAAVSGLVDSVPLVVLPASPDGRDLAPRLAARLGRPLVAGAVEAHCCRTERNPGRDHPDSETRTTIRAELARLDDRVLVPVEVAGPAVVTLVPGPHPAPPSGPPPERVEPLTWSEEPSGGFEGAEPDPEVLAVLEPDVRTMDLAEATRVVAGGGGLAAGADDRETRSRFELLEQVAAALGASAGATRVATDAGWAPSERQIGTTGVTVSPDLYLALGIAGAAQHVGGLGSPRHVISVNTDGACPMTAMADLGLITDAPALLAELAARLGVTTAVGEPPEGRELGRG